MLRNRVSNAASITRTPKTTSICAVTVNDEHTKSKFKRKLRG